MPQVGREQLALVAPAHTPALSGGKVDLTPGFVVDATELKGAIAYSANAGTARAITFTFAGTYVAGDTVIATVTDNSVSRQKWIKSYRYTVVAGDTVTTIAAAITAKIVADGVHVECPYTSTSAAGVSTVTSKQLDKNTLVGVVSNVSTLGTIAYAVSVAGTRKEGYPSDLIAAGVPEDDITLASYDTVRINYQPLVPQPMVDSATPAMKEILWFGTAGEGAALATLINSL